MKRPIARPDWVRKTLTGEQRTAQECTIVYLENRSRRCQRVEAIISSRGIALERVSRANRFCP